MHLQLGEHYHAYHEAREVPNAFQRLHEGLIMHGLQEGDCALPSIMRRSLKTLQLQSHQAGLQTHQHV